LIEVMNGNNEMVDPAGHRYFPVRRVRHESGRDRSG
jgi:hypothetical protein